MNHNLNLSAFTKNIGIDLGTANTLVYLGGKGIILRERSVVCVDSTNNEITAIGNPAFEMLGRTPENIYSIRPLKDGVIADFDITREMIRTIIKRVTNSGFFLMRPRVIVCVPAGVTDVEKRAVEEAVMMSGAKSVTLIEEPMAAAIGAGLPVDKPVGSMIVDIGGGTTEVAIISLCGIVVSKSLRIAGDFLDNSIMSFVKREFNIAIGEKTAEEIKQKIGSAQKEIEEEFCEITGRDILSGLPRTVNVSSALVSDAMSEGIYQMVETIRSTLEQTPPELAGDIMNTGITLTGGGALIKNIDKIITNATGLRVRICENPLDCVAIGTLKALENDKILKRSMFAYRK